MQNLALIYVLVVVVLLLALPPAFAALLTRLAKRDKDIKSAGATSGAAQKSRAGLATPPGRTSSSGAV